MKQNSNLMSKFLLISIHEKFVDKILSGEKTIELRKSKPNIAPGESLIIYTTKPKKAITAIAVINNIISLSPHEMWEKYSDKLGISKDDFDLYYKNSGKAIGIELINVYKLDDAIFLNAIKAIYPNFSPPQTFKYLNKFSTLKNFHKKN
ncbi:ASCH domain-containing protein [Sphingobacterium cavernae]|uniref:ASCH domain-containing protein n=1 Tax=Sphingobacterium cavernae TaxID=2592657 RepID=UPI0012300D47|nr:ASCH domain-containing protein [Sphingobacterium cavernae]